MSYKRASTILAKAVINRNPDLIHLTGDTEKLREVVRDVCDFFTGGEMTAFQLNRLEDMVLHCLMDKKGAFRI